MGLKLVLRKKQKKGNEQACTFVEKETVSTHNFVEQPFLVLQKLRNEEANLMEEKENLNSLRQRLQLKLQNKIRRKERNIQKLRAEIKDMKFSCEQLSKTFRQTQSWDRTDQIR